MLSLILLSFIAVSDQIFSLVITEKNRIENISDRKRTGFRSRWRDLVSKHLSNPFASLNLTFVVSKMT